GGSSGLGCAGPRRRHDGRPRTRSTRCRAPRTLPPALRGTPGQRPGPDAPPRSSSLRGQAGAPLGAAAGDDRAAGAGAHAEPEAVALGPATVVRLVGALGHLEILAGG